MPRRSTLLIVLPAMLIAAAGWFDVGPVDAVSARLRGSRADWQPSPIPVDWAAPVLPVQRPGSPPQAPVSAPSGVGAQPPGANQSAPVLPIGPPTVPTRQPGLVGPTGPPVVPTVARSGAAASTPTPAPTARPAAPGTATVGATARSAAKGEWHEEHLESKALNQRLPFLIWVPPGYTTSQRYPVVYMLHGAGDGFTAGRAEWFNLGMKDALDESLAAGDIPPTIFVFPEGLQGYWINHANGGPRWADYVIEDVVPHVDRIWATDARPERRAIGGLSMGGHGALHLALNHSDVFRVAAAHSPALRSLKDSPPFFGDADWFARFDPLTLASKSGRANRLNVWIDLGDTDRWRPDAARLSDALDKNGAKVQLQVYSGRHEGGYWTDHLREYLRFYGNALRVR